jgi:hypothetical protein
LLSQTRRNDRSGETMLLAFYMNVRLCDRWVYWSSELFFPRPSIRSCSLHCCTTSLRGVVNTASKLGLAGGELGTNIWALGALPGRAQFAARQNLAEEHSIRSIV